MNYKQAVSVQRPYYNQGYPVYPLNQNYQGIPIYSESLVQPYYTENEFQSSINPIITRVPKEQKEQKDKKEFKEQKERCYTCKPRGKVLKHVIGYSACNTFMYHHDMNHRPIILITPVKHISNITDFTPDELTKLFVSIKSFCNFWNIIDYQISFNEGSWKAHDHFHIKIKISEKIANRMRGDHFKKISLEKNYK